MSTRFFLPEKLNRLSSLVATLFALSRQRHVNELAAKAFRLWKRAGWNGIFQRLALLGHSYRHWVRLFDCLDDNDRQMIRDHIAKLKRRPLISILMPTYNPSERWLRQAIESVRAQLYPDWELCVADDASTALHVRAVLEQYATLDSRIRVIYRKENGHISEASNSALELANGEFIALLDQDDELAEHALYMVAWATNEYPRADLIYSDEDKIDTNGHRFDPYFKPDWNPELFRCQNMVSHLGVYRTAAVRALGGFRKGFEGSQDWDLALRITEEAPVHKIHHIPHVLYHWRVHPDSTASSINAKQYAITAGKRAVMEHLERRKIKAEVLPIPLCSGYWRIRYALPEHPPLVSIIIPTRNGLSLLKRCIDTLQTLTSYPNYELIVVDNQSDDPETLNFLKEKASKGEIQVCQYDAPFNYSAINNAAVGESHGELLCFLNNDIEVTDGDWLSELVSLAIQQGIGAVGARLLYPDGRIQHAGVIVGMGGVAGHLYLGAPGSERGNMGRAILQQNLSAITGACMVVTREAFKHVGGFDADNLPVGFNDVDFCLKLLEAGYDNRWTPHATLVHHESASRGKDDTAEKKARFAKEVAYMHQRWERILANDPAYNPNLTLDYTYPFPSYPPRIDYPWKTYKQAHD